MHSEPPVVFGFVFAIKKEEEELEVARDSSSKSAPPKVYGGQVGMTNGVAQNHDEHGSK